MFRQGDKVSKYINVFKNMFVKNCCIHKYTIIVMSKVSELIFKNITFLIESQRPIFFSAYSLVAVD